MKKNNTFGYAAVMAGMAAMALTSCASLKSQQGKDNSMNATKIETESQMDEEYLILSEAERNAVEQTNVFALNLMRTQAGMDSKVISPISVAYLMGMLANGANGVTQTEILKTLNMDATQLQTLNDTYRSIFRMASRLDKQTKINIANCIAVNKQIELKGDYAKAMQQLYNANVENMDFGSPKALNKINGWCAKQTDGMIPKIIEQLDANGLAVLMNAIYFNGSWAEKFDKADTKTENFRGYTRDIK